MGECKCLGPSSPLLILFTYSLLLFLADMGFTLLARNPFWTDLFQRHFIEFVYNTLYCILFPHCAGLMARDNMFIYCFYRNFLADMGFMLVARNTFWTDLFQRHFIDAPQDEQKDDMLFYVKKSTAKSRFQIPQVNYL